MGGEGTGRAGRGAREDTKAKPKPKSKPKTLAKPKALAIQGFAAKAAKSSKKVSLSKD